MVPSRSSSQTTTAATWPSTPTPASCWATRGRSCSTCRVSDVAVDPDAQANYAEMKRRGSHTGTTRLRHSDGSEIEMHFRASQTTVGGMLVYIGTCWPAD